MAPGLTTIFAKVAVSVMKSVRRKCLDKKKMLNNLFSFKIGQLECTVIIDIPNENGLSLDTSCLFVKMPQKNLLIDTGWGVGIQPNSGKALENLATVGISRKDIDIVIITHAHPDHIGGNTDTEGEPLFPNARYIINKREWEYWLSNPTFSPQAESIKPVALASIQKNLRGIKNRFELIEIKGKNELIPGITLIEAPGHSPGLIALRISSEFEHLLCISDIFHQPSELKKLNWSIISGNLTEQAIQTRSKILSIAASCTIVFACHFPFPGLGRIERDGDDWSWQPLNPSSTI